MNQIEIVPVQNSIMKLLERIAKYDTVIFLAFKIVCDYIYWKYICDIYSYSGSIAEPSISKNIFGWIALVVLLLLYNNISKGDIKFCVSFLMTLSIIPTLSVFWIRNESIICFFEILIYWIIFEVTAIIFSRQKRKIRKEKCDLKLKNNSIIFAIWVVAIICTVFFSYKYGEFRFWVSFEDVYEYRLDTSNQMNVVERYIFGWTSSIFIPLCFSIHTINKRWLFAVVDVCLSLMSYAIYGNKVIVFQIVVVIGLLLIIKNSYNYCLGSVICILCTGASLLAVLIYNILGNKIPLSLCMRVFFIPSEAHYYYFDFFQTEPLLLLRQSVLRHFFSNPLSDTAAVLIGSDVRYNLTGGYNNLNNGLFSDAYQNFGFVGVLIYPFVVVFFLFLLCKVLKDFNPLIKYSLLIGLVFSMFSGYLFSWLLSGGVILVFIIVYLIKHYRIRIDTGDT